jgi:hypothetical protein
MVDASWQGNVQINFCQNGLAFDCTCDVTRL